MVVQDRFPGGEKVYFLFISDILNVLLKTTGERDRQPNFVIFAVLSALIVRGWWAVAGQLKLHLLCWWFY